MNDVAFYDRTNLGMLFARYKKHVASESKYFLARRFPIMQL